MSKLLKRFGIGFLSLTLIAVCSVALFLGWALHRVRSRMPTPKLDTESLAVGDLQFETLDGKSQHLATFKGKVVFLNLWGTWCIPCVAEMPTVQELYNHYRGDPSVQFLIVSRLDPPSHVQWYADHFGYTLPFYVTRDQDIPDSMQFHQYPATFVFGRDGRLVSKHIGPANWSGSTVISLIDRFKAEQ
jgi:thiol-disulfide isomerase/thioredoxin